MRPIEFEEQNCIYAKDQPEYLPLPAHRTEDGQVTSCWELDEDEIQQIIRDKKIYLTLLTFGDPLQPIMISVVNPLRVVSIQEENS